MTEQIEFQVSEAGAPNLQADIPDQPTETAATTVVTSPAGWTPDEAAQAFGGYLSAFTSLAYMFKWQQMPGPELWPVIVGDPKAEFPLTGAMLAPFLDLIAPKGSAAAVGVSAGGVVTELGMAVVKRAGIVMTVAPKGKQAPAPPPPGPAPQAPPDEGGSFKFNRNELRVIDSPYEQLGFA